MAEDADLSGTIVDGKYRLSRLIGRGGVGSVYAAVHEFTERKVAVKLLSRRAASHASMPQRFLREARAPAAINHPRIVQVLDAGQEESGRLYVVFELLDGESLGSAIANGRISDLRALRVATQILEALEAAHAHDLVHRDIKPENIFMLRCPGREPEPKLLDFGVARWIRAGEAPLTQAGTILGTPDFMSPEQLTGREVDARVDLWAMGVVLYYALSRRLPFGAKNALALLTEMVTNGPRPLVSLRPDLPDYVLELIERSLSKDLDHRFQSAREMASELRRCAARMDVSSDAETIPLAKQAVPKRVEDRPKWATALEEIERESERIAGKKPKK